jgi:hypothetical protein
VWSVEGQGSTFTLSLPQHQPHHGAEGSLEPLQTQPTTGGY